MNDEASQNYLVKTLADIFSKSLIWSHNLMMIIHIAVSNIASKSLSVKCIVAADNCQAEAVTDSKRESENHLCVIHFLLQ